MYYILDENHLPVSVPLEEWAKWYETGNRRVALTMIGDTSISTVFLGIIYNGGLFETMVFTAHPDDQEIERYWSWTEALEGHNQMVRKWESKLAGRVQAG